MTCYTGECGSAACDCGPDRECLDCGVEVELYWHGYLCEACSPAFVLVAVGDTIRKKEEVDAQL